MKRAATNGQRRRCAAASWVDLLCPVGVRWSRDDDCAHKRFQNASIGRHLHPHPQTARPTCSATTANPRIPPAGLEPAISCVKGVARGRVSDLSRLSTRERAWRSVPTLAPSRDVHRGACRKDGRVVRDQPDLVGPLHRDECPSEVLLVTLMREQVQRHALVDDLDSELRL
jgi:hypothetical protein